MYKWCVCTICLFEFFETERNLKSLYGFNLINFEMVTHTSITIILLLCIFDCFIITIYLKLLCCIIIIYTAHTNLYLALFAR